MAWAACAIPIRMQTIDLKISVSDATLGLIDALKTGRTREEVVRSLIELGLCEMLEATARAHREEHLHSTLRRSEDLKLARNNLISVKEPRSADQDVEEQSVASQRRYETIQQIMPRAARG